MSSHTQPHAQRKATRSGQDEARYVDLDSITQPIRIRKADGTVHAATIEPEKPSKGMGMAAVSTLVVLLVTVVALGAVGMVAKHTSDQQVQGYKASEQRSHTTSADQLVSFHYPADWADRSATLTPAMSRVQKDAVPVGEISGIAGVTLLEQTPDVTVPTMAEATDAVNKYTADVQTGAVSPASAVSQCVPDSVELVGTPRTFTTRQTVASVLRFTCVSSEGTKGQVWQLRGYVPGPPQQPDQAVAGRMFVLTYYGQQLYWKINEGLWDQLLGQVRLDSQPIPALG